MNKKGLVDDEIEKTSREPNRIVWWTIEVEWGDGTRQTLSEIPNHVAKEVDAYLTELEEEQES
jgi:hypothetical protein